MKITLEFEHPHELINLLKSLGSNLKEDEPAIGALDYKDSFPPLNTFGYMDDSE